MKLYFVTGNKKKFSEVKKLVPNIQQLSVDLVEIQEMDSQKIIEHKLQEAQSHARGMIAVEDVSCSMAALGGLPGPLIKWFLAEIGADGLYQIAKNAGNDQVIISATVGLRLPDGTVQFFEGSVPGNIVAPRGDMTFGFDPVFQPEGLHETFGELTIEEKNKFSHRAQAWMKVKAFLETMTE